MNEHNYDGISHHIEDVQIVRRRIVDRPLNVHTVSERRNMMVHLVHCQALLDVSGEVAYGALEWTISAVIFHVSIQVPFVLFLMRTQWYM